ncbi:MAG: hypothetical protein HKO57_10065 [Akkermansiaceae bacterium]|nr:hypothetical protein [Akkermansiaceae bacterium]
MKSSSVILFVISLLLLAGLYIYVDDRFTKMDARLQGAESALDTLEPFRSALARGPGGNPVKDAYAPVQATGAPNAGVEGRDSARAWCPAAENGGEEWLLLEYADRVEARAARVVANYGPGAVVRLVAIDPDGAEIIVWSGPAAGEGAGLRGEIPLASPRGIRRLRVVLDTAAVDGWNEIDAVGLVDRDGKIHWATGAEASSFWTPKAPREAE